MWCLARNFLLTIAWYFWFEAVLGHQKEEINKSSSISQKWIHLGSKSSNLISTKPEHENYQHFSEKNEVSLLHDKTSLLSRHKRQFFGGGGCCLPFQMNPICCPVPLPVPMPVPFPLPMPMPMPIPVPQPIGGGCCSCCMPMCLPTCIPRCGFGGLGLGGLGGLGGMGFGGMGMGGMFGGGCGSPFGFGYKKHRKTKF